MTRSSGTWVMCILCCAALTAVACDSKNGGDEDATDMTEEDLTTDGDAVTDSVGDIPADGADTSDVTGDPDAGDGTSDPDAADAADTTSDTTADSAEDPDVEEDSTIDSPDDPDIVEDIPLDEPGDTAMDSPMDLIEVGDTFGEFLVEIPGEGTASITGVVRRSATLSVGVDAASDGVGHVLVALFDCQPFSTLLCSSEPLLVHESTAPVDLSDPTSEYPYTFSELVAGPYYVFAALDDDGSGFDTRPWEYAPVDQGDLASHPAPEYYLFSSSTLTGANVTLDIRASRLHGDVTTDPLLAYTGDGLGDLVVGASDTDPTMGGAFLLYGLHILPGVDILDATPESYDTVLLAPAGSFYVFAYLDDDATGIIPVTGDPATIPSLTSSVVTMGTDLTVDPILDTLVP